MVAVSLDVVTFCSDFLTKHLQTVVAGFVHLARLAFSAEVAVARSEFADDTKKSKVTVVMHLLALHINHNIVY